VHSELKFANLSVEYDSERPTASHVTVTVVLLNGFTFLAMHIKRLRFIV